MINPLHRRSQPAGYARAIAARTLCRMLERLSPELDMYVVDDGDTTTHLHARDSVITPWILATGSYQRAELLRVLELLDQHLPDRHGQTFVDVGANIGTTTLYAMRSGRYDRAVCVEPVPRNCSVLLRNMEANGLKEVVTLVPEACDAVVGSVQLLVSDSNTGDHRVRRSSSAERNEGSSTVSVASSTLEAILERSGALDDVGLVWVDTQGHEPEVLSGAGRLLERAVPFVMEFWPALYRDSDTLDGFLGQLSAKFDAFVDLADSDPAPEEMQAIAGLTERLLDDRDQTDLLLLPKVDH